MRLPRRVPWSSTTELEQVCAWIFTDEDDLPSKELAIGRLSAWKAITPLPHALESTLALLVVIIYDRNTSAHSLNHLPLRQSYAAAIIRLVNSLVDPLQLGAYARSIASIAAQLGLPGWLVELRHAATHEDLPSLELLREAARQSMTWLLHNYFLPTISPESASRPEVPPLRPIAPVLKRYKTGLKTITRDASLRARYKQEVNTIMRDIERWIAEAKVAANIIVGEVGWNVSGSQPGEPQTRNREGSIDPKTKWALEQFCNALLEKGILVPLSKKKRVFPGDKFWPPQLSVSLWSPLLKHIQLLHTDFAHTLCTSIISTLLAAEEYPMSTSAPNDSGAALLSNIDASLKAQNDPSYEMCLARWVTWAVDTWSNPKAELSSADLEHKAGVNLAKDVVVLLMQMLGHRLGELHARNTKTVKALLQSLCQQNPSYQEAVDFLTQPSGQFSVKVWTEQDIATMTDRLDLLLSMAAPSPMSTPVIKGNPDTTNADSTSVEIDTIIDIDLPGWRRLDTVNWKPCPIGVFYKSRVSS